jgi:two-component system cell cycle sensor histidine kinase/response regulator CckA
VRDHCLTENYVTSDSQFDSAPWRAGEPGKPGVERLSEYLRENFMHQPFSILFSQETASAGLSTMELMTAAKAGDAPGAAWPVGADAMVLAAGGTGSTWQHSAQDTSGSLKTKRDEAEQSPVERSELKYRFLTESIPEMVWMANPDGAIDYYNQHWYEFTGLTPAQSEGWAWLEVVHPEDREETRRRWEHSIETGEGLDVECRLRNAYGAYSWHIRRAVSHLGPQGEILKWFGTCTDIEEQKQAERALRQAAKLESIGVLAGGVAHDFNNLLTGILGNTSIALEMLEPDHPVRNVLEAAMRASRSAADLTQQLLAYAGKGRIVLAPVNLSGMVQDITGLLETSLPRTVALRLELANDLPLVEADYNRIQQVVVNLIMNGAEALGTSEGSVIVVTRSIYADEKYIRGNFAPGELKPGKYVSVEVHDSGCGMDEATQARIFDPFFTTKFMGRGLGLAAAAGIVRSHKGAIKVYSTPGKGSTFRLLFPAIVPAEMENDLRPLSKPPMGTGNILVVDDQAAVRDVAQSALEMFGYSVLLAENGKEAVELFRTQAESVDVVVLDLTMPVMDGEEALRHLVQIRPDVKIILSSGYSEVDAVRKFSGKGLAGFLQKPYTARRLGEAVTAAMKSDAEGTA